MALGFPIVPSTKEEEEEEAEEEEEEEERYCIHDNL